MNRPVCYVELHTPDVAVAQRFYGELFGWKIAKPDHPTPAPYLEISEGPGLPGGVSQVPGARWAPYIEVPDLDAAMAQARALGAKEITPRREVPGMGSACLVTDPSGSTFGLWQPKSA